MERILSLYNLHELVKTSLQSVASIISFKRRQLSASKISSSFGVFALCKQTTPSISKKIAFINCSDHNFNNQRNNSRRIILLSLILSHIFMDTQLLIIAFLRIRTLDKLFEATIALVNFRIYYFPNWKHIFQRFILQRFMPYLMSFPAHLILRMLI